MFCVRMSRSWKIFTVCNLEIVRNVLKVIIMVTILSHVAMAQTTAPSQAPSYAPVSPPSLYSIALFAGTGSTSFSGDGGKATAAALRFPYGLFRDSLGVMYIGDHVSRVRAVSTNDIISTYVGSSSTPGFSGDGGQATSASIDSPAGVWGNSLGVLYIYTSDYRIRAVSNSGIMSTYAGTGSNATTSDTGPATSVTIRFGYSVRGDSVGNLYIADYDSVKVRKVSSTGIMSTVLGTGVVSYAGDGGKATAASMNIDTKFRMFLDSMAYIFITESGRIRKVDGSTQIITTYAGTGTNSYNGDGLTATSTKLNRPRAIWGDTTGQMYWTGSYQLRLCTTSNIVYTIGGDSVSTGSSGDGGYATAALFSSPHFMTGDTQGNLFIADIDNYNVRKLTNITPNPTIAPSVAPTVAPTTPTVTPTTSAPSVAPSKPPSAAPTYTPVVAPSLYYSTLYAGSGSTTYSGDGGKATAASVRYPFGIFRNTLGVFYFSDHVSRIRSIDTNDIVSVFVGTSSSGTSGDGGAATSAKIDTPTGLWVSSTGVMFIYTYDDFRVRSVSSSGKISTYVGTGVAGSSGDGEAASSALINSGYDLYGDSMGGLYIADASSAFVSFVSAGGIISTVAGTGSAAYAGDGGKATAASLFASGYFRMFVDTVANIFTSESGRIRKIDGSTQIISTYAGTGSNTYNGDGLPATSTRLNTPKGIWGDTNGQLFWTGNVQIRMCTASNIVYVIGGSTITGNSGDEGYATAALYNTPHYITGDTVGHLWVADTANVNIRKLTLQVPTWSPTALPTQPTVTPSISPSIVPTVKPTIAPSKSPSIVPSLLPTVHPSIEPSVVPTVLPSIIPSNLPTLVPTITPTIEPTVHPTDVPTAYPTSMPTSVPSEAPTSDSFSVTIVVGLAVGAVGLVLLIAGSFYYVRYRSKRRFKLKPAEIDTKVAPMIATDGMLIKAEEGSKRQPYTTPIGSVSTPTQLSHRSMSIAPDLAAKTINKNDIPVDLLPFINDNVDKIPDVLTYKQIVDALKDKTDVFLTHNWGKDQANHKRVAEVNQKLQFLGFRTWFDSEKMKGSVKDQMTKGIDNASCIVVFITQDYIDKVASDNKSDNCKLEFGYAELRKTASCMVPVVMEKEASYQQKWKGEVGMVLGGMLYVGMFDSISDESVQQLHDRIMEVIGVRIQTLLDECIAVMNGQKSQEHHHKHRHHHHYSKHKKIETTTMTTSGKMVVQSMSDSESDEDFDELLSVSDSESDFNEEVRKTVPVTPKKL